MDKAFYVHERFFNSRPNIVLFRTPYHEIYLRQDGKDTHLGVNIGLL